MVAGVGRPAINTTARKPTSLFHSLLCRVVAELAQARPVLRVPEQLPCRLDPNGITTVLGVLQFGGDLVVDDGCRNWPLIRRTHRAVRMFTQMAVARLLPLVAVTTFGAAAASFIRWFSHERTLTGPTHHWMALHRRRLGAWLPIVRKDRWQRLLQPSP